MTPELLEHLPGFATTDDGSLIFQRSARTTSNEKVLIRTWTYMKYDGDALFLDAEKKQIHHHGPVCFLTIKLNQQNARYSQWKAQRTLPLRNVLRLEPFLVHINGQTWRLAPTDQTVEVDA